MIQRDELTIWVYIRWRIAAWICTEMEQQWRSMGETMARHARTLGIDGTPPAQIGKNR